MTGSDDDLPKKIGNFTILRRLGRGGMGEVFLAYDPVCEREIALKQIRTDLTSHEIIKNRFLREAKITSQLAHPAIVPIYSIHEKENLLYYIMPYLEGKTLKQIIYDARKPSQVEFSSKVSSESSINSLARIFVSICQAIAYAHSKGFLHRDLKPENVIVGKYGQVLILDWGLVQPIAAVSEVEEEMNITHSAASSSLTRPGKIVGTLAYMSPERALGSPSSVQTDIYALGIILYQLLTLHFPFHRRSLRDFKKVAGKEQLPDPSSVAPYRDVPPELTEVVKKATSFPSSERYQFVDEMIGDLENYLEGRFSWFPAAKLSAENKADWEFQEHLLLREHTAITHTVETTDWITLMVSKRPFAENIQLRAQIKFSDKSQGIGLLLCIPEASERTHPTEGYYLWLSSQSGHPSKLYRSNVEVLELPELMIRPNKWHSIKLEKHDDNINFYLNDACKFSYMSHLPLAGNHIGILYRDTDFEITPLEVSLASHNLTVSCLAVPDAFLANKDYLKAINEYRRIGISFPGRAESREALFRAGVTLLEQAKNEENDSKAHKTYTLALEEFEKLHGTAGAPLEYLGKSLVYESMHDNEEEANCLELACRRYPKNPLTRVVEEQILLRMHTSSQHNRMTAYRFLLLAARHLSEHLHQSEQQKIFRRLQHHWEPLYFLEGHCPEHPFEDNRGDYFAIPLAFWLDKPLVLEEIIEELIPKADQHLQDIHNALFCLLELGALDSVETQLGKLDSPNERTFIELMRLCLKQSLTPSEESWEELFTPSTLASLLSQKRFLFYLLNLMIQKDHAELVEELASKISTQSFTEKEKIQLESLRIWSFLLLKNWNAAEKIFLQYSLPLLNQEATLLYFLYGCWLHATEDKEIAYIHFSGILDTAYPRSWALAAHYLVGPSHNTSRWLKQAFSWEKRQLYKQLSLFYHCIGDQSLSNQFKQLENAESN